MNLLDIFPESRLLLDVEARDKKGAIREIMQSLIQSDVVTDDIAKKLERAVNKREAQGSTGIGKGLAIPHAKECSFLDEVVAVLARSRDGIEFNSVDGELVHLIFFIATPADRSDSHLLIMRKIARMHRDEKTLKFFMTTNKVPSVLEILREIDESVD